MGWVIGCNTYFFHKDYCSETTDGEDQNSKFILTLINSMKTTTFSYHYSDNGQVYQYTCSAKAISGASRVTKGQNMKLVPAGWL